MSFTRGGVSAKDALLVLQDASFFLGEGFGSDRTTIGELVFNTSMTGYQEAMTDPSYAGQVLTFAYPLLGNYGINEEDNESQRIHVKAMVCREVTSFYSHYKARSSLDEWMKTQDIPGIHRVDTRAIVRRVRESGVVPCAVARRDPSQSVEDQVRALQSTITKYRYSEIDFVREVSVPEKKKHVVQNAKKHVAFIDCGGKTSMLQELLLRGMNVTVYPYQTSAEEIMRDRVDGLLFSNGPGDPTMMKKTVATAKQLLAEKPLFGICLGNQVLALALGAKTFKLTFGHRGSNHAVRNLETQRLFITSQNHGFAVTDLPSDVLPLYENCNDGTNEGLRHKTLPIFSCQFHPEGHVGPKDSNELFDEFVKSL
ncbi:glutamine-hydrolyzing carbamoyl-phosphate synthase small subunit [Candidatus Micrarchaeota archaeon]|nr:glutamine-hydrolyzing carbamoyl-phosphate synthase small subunit [Candidatus Micrarchaeota archaeon]